MQNVSATHGKSTARGWKLTMGTWNYLWCFIFSLFVCTEPLTAATTQIHTTGSPSTEPGGTSGPTAHNSSATTAEPNATTAHSHPDTSLLSLSTTQMVGGEERMETGPTVTKREGRSPGTPSRSYVTSPGTPTTGPDTTATSMDTGSASASSLPPTPSSSHSSSSPTGSTGATPSPERSSTSGTSHPSTALVFSTVPSASGTELDTVTAEGTMHSPAPSTHSINPVPPTSSPSPTSHMTKASLSSTLGGSTETSAAGHTSRPLTQGQDMVETGTTSSSMGSSPLPSTASVATSVMTSPGEEENPITHQGSGTTDSNAKTSHSLPATTLTIPSTMNLNTSTPVNPSFTGTYSPTTLSIQPENVTKETTRFTEQTATASSGNGTTGLTEQTTTVLPGNETTGLTEHKTTALPGNETTGLTEHTTTAPPGNGTTGFTEHTTTASSGNGTTGLTEHTTTAPPENKTTGLTEHTTTAPPENKTTGLTEHTTTAPLGNGTTGFTTSTFISIFTTTFTSAPCIPVSIEVQNVTGEGIELSWTSGSTGSLYEISLMDGNQKINKTTTKETKYLFQHLLPGHVYNISVAVSSCAESNRTSVIVRTDPVSCFNGTDFCLPENTGCSDLRDVVCSNNQAFACSVLLKSQTFNNTLYNSDSPDYKELSESIKTDVVREMRIELQDDGFDIVVLGFRPGSVIADFISLLPKEDPVDVNLVQQHLSEILKRKFGPQTEVTVQSLSAQPSTDNSSGWRVAVIVLGVLLGVALVLILLAMLCYIYMMKRSSKYLVEPTGLMGTFVSKHL